MPLAEQIQWEKNIKIKNIVNKKHRIEQNIVRLCILSDTHGLHLNIEKKFGELPDSDILIHAGDISNVGEIWDIQKSGHQYPVVSAVPR